MSARDPAGAGSVHALEVAGLVGFLACLGWFLLHSYSLIVFSDPMEWYLFGRDFSERFAGTGLAYGFPLLMSGAVAAVGPFKAYLVNLPVLIVLAALLYLYARLQVSGLNPVAAALGAAAALGLLVAVDARLLLALVNPYRDALSYAFVLLAGVLVISASRQPRRAAWLAAGAGASLGLAVSTRETSLLMLGPFALYAAVARWCDPELPWLRPALAFALALGISCAPLLIQNQLVGGAAWVPGQAAQSFAEEGSLVPGIRLAHLPETLPALAAELRARYGIPLLLALGVGLGCGAWRRLPAVWALSAPALVLYVLFYGAYLRRVSRYGFVIDLFALAIAAAGVAVLADALLARWRPHRALPLAALAAVFAAAGWAGVEQGRVSRTRLRLDDVERFVRDFEASVPAEATVVGFRPVTDLIRGFTPHATEVVGNYWELQARLSEIFGGGGERVLVARGENADRIVEAGFDLVDTRSFDPAAYGFQRHFGDEPIRVSRVVPWSRRQTRTRIQVGEPGEYVVGVDVGRLSTQPRSLAMVLWGEETIARQPVDGLNYLAVSVPEAPRMETLRLVSDGPVPAVIDAEIAPLRRPLVLDFADDHLLPHLGRFSWSFLTRPWLGTPSITRDGYVDVPTVRPKDAAFVVQARAGLVPTGAVTEREVAVEVGGDVLQQWTLRSDAPAGSAPDWQNLEFVLHEPRLGDPLTRVHWALRDGEAGAGEATLALGQLQVQRLQLRTSLRVEPARPRDRVYLDGGFGAVEPHRGRWTRGDATVRLLLAETDEPGLITLRYVSAIHPTSKPPRPRFRFDGEPRTARYTPDGRLNTAEIPLPPGALRGVAHRLEILVPADENGRGIMLDSVRIHPLREQPPSARNTP